VDEEFDIVYRFRLWLTYMRDIEESHIKLEVDCFAYILNIC
jgi:hypothetical protein